MHILLTCFEPFGQVAVNPSMDAVALLPESLDGHILHRVTLPVEYTVAGVKMADAVRQTGARLLICVGAAAGRKAVTPELVALNWRMASIPDNAGVSYTGEVIDPAVPAALRTNLPVVEMAEKIREEGIPAEVSLSAGAYVCNDLYWAALSQREFLGCEGLFVHVPLQEVVPPEKAAHALEVCIRCAIKDMGGK